MAQLTIYLDDETRRRIEQAAADSGTSVSGWAVEQLRAALEDRWPEGYFEEVLGSLAESDLERPAQPDTGLDVRREEL